MGTVCLHCYIKWIIVLIHWRNSWIFSFSNVEKITMDFECICNEFYLWSTNTQMHQTRHWQVNTDNDWENLNVTTLSVSRWCRTPTHVGLLTGRHIYNKKCQLFSLILALTMLNGMLVFRSIWNSVFEMLTAPFCVNRCRPWRVVYGYSNKSRH